MNNASQYRELETELKVYILQLELADGFPLLPQYPAEDRINRLAIDCFDRPIFMRQNGILTVFSFDGGSANSGMLGNGTYRLEEIESRQPITRFITKNIIGILKAWAMRAESVLNAPPAAPATLTATASLKPKHGDAEADCIACLSKHMDWTNQQIAEHVGIHPASIVRARMPKFFAARDAMAGLPTDAPRGHKTNNDDGSDFEATYRDDDGLNAIDDG